MGCCVSKIPNKKDGSFTDLKKLHTFSSQKSLLTSFQETMKESNIDEEQI